MKSHSARSSPRSFPSVSFSPISSPNVCFSSSSFSVVISSPMSSPTVNSTPISPPAVNSFPLSSPTVSSCVNPSLAVNFSPAPRYVNRISFTPSSRSNTTNSQGPNVHKSSIYFRSKTSVSVGGSKTSNSN